MFYVFHSKQMTTLNTHMLFFPQFSNKPSLSSQISSCIILKVHSNIFFIFLLPISIFCSISVFLNLNIIHQYGPVGRNLPQSTFKCLPALILRTCLTNLKCNVNHNSTDRTASTTTSNLICTLMSGRMTTSWFSASDDNFVPNTVEQVIITASGCTHTSQMWPEPAALPAMSHSRLPHRPSIAACEQTLSLRHELLFYQQLPWKTLTFFTCSQPHLTAGRWTRTADLLLVDIHLCQSVGVHTHLQLHPINVPASASGRPHGGVSSDVRRIGQRPFPFTSVGIHYVCVLSRSETISWQQTVLQGGAR